MAYRVIENYSRESVYLDDGTSVFLEQREVIEEPVYLNVEVYKSNEEQRLVSGWANVAKNADGTLPKDWDGDIIDPVDLEKAAIDFMLDYRESGEMHKGFSKGTVVESIVFTKQKMEVLGIPEGSLPEGWFITVKVHDDEAFQKVKDGEYKMFSIQGKAKRVKV